MKPTKPEAPSAKSSRRTPTQPSSPSPTSGRSSSPVASPARLDRGLPHRPRRPTPCPRLAERDATEERWRALVERHSPRLRASIHRALRRAGVEPKSEDVEEIAQESYCRLLVCGRLAPENGGERGLSGFLARVGERLAFDAVRKERALKRGCGRLRGLSDIAVESLATVADRAPTQERALLALDLWRKTARSWREIVGGRTPGRDVVIVSLGLAGWSSRQISDACSGRLRPETIDSIVGRTRLRLAEAGIDLPVRARGVHGTRRGAALAEPKRHAGPPSQPRRQEAAPV